MGAVPAPSAKAALPARSFETPFTIAEFSPAESLLFCIRFCFFFLFSFLFFFPPSFRVDPVDGTRGKGDDRFFFPWRGKLGREGVQEEPAVTVLFFLLRRNLCIVCYVDTLFRDIKERLVGGFVHVQVYIRRIYKVIIFNFIFFFGYNTFFFFIIDLKRMRIYLFGGTRRRNHDFKVIFIYSSTNVV